MKVNHLKHFVLFFISISISGITNINSPDKNLSLKFFISDGKAFYKIDYKTQTIIDTSGLGFEFLNCIESGTKSILEHPELYRIYYSNFRRCLIKRFPFSIFYTTEKDAIIVHSVFSNRQDPNKLP